MADLQSRGPSVARKSEKEFMYVYLSFFCAASIAYETHSKRSNLGLSTFITLAVALQLLAYSLLALKVVKQQSVRGVSAKALMCQACVYASRLCSTTWLRGYIPTDSTGNWLYQLTDAMSLTLVLLLLYCVFRRYRSTYQAEEDTFQIDYMLGGCLMLAVVLHPHLNSRPMFDTLWTFALYVDTVAMLPQLWMIAKLGAGAEIETLNAHYVAAISAARGVSLYFWTYGFKEFAPKDGSFNFTGWAIMLAHVLQVVVMLDFVYYYVKAWFCKPCINAAMKTCGDQSHPTVPVTLDELEASPIESRAEALTVV